MRQERPMASLPGAMSQEQSHGKADYYMCRVYTQPLFPISWGRSSLRATFAKFLARVASKPTGKAAGGASCWVVGEAEIRI